MTKPMYCPFGFANPELANTRGEKNSVGLHVVHCTPDCAWAVSDGKDYGCVIAYKPSREYYIINVQPIEDDAK